MLVAVDHFAVLDEEGVRLPAGVAAVAVFGIDAGAHHIGGVVADLPGGNVLVFMHLQIFPRLREAAVHHGMGVDQGLGEVAFDELFVVARVAAVVHAADLIHGEHGGFGQAGGEQEAT